SVRNVDFAKTPVNCGDCHENPHADQFGAKAMQCAICHNTVKWRPSLFDHDTTAFPLKGGHENVACSACHTLRQQVEGNEVLFYKPTPTKCEACHDGGVPKMTNGSSSNVSKVLRETVAKLDY